ncbi:MAG: hypothetical protein C4531_09485 [Desulfurivibrio sp.]|nr:MAG: hypothetical protein C4531_09485 [Desulfurivibrio sp.]
MKTLIITHDTYGTKAEVNARTTYLSDFGEWIAEVDATEIRSACDTLCRGIKNCSCEALRGEAAQDDDGKEYSILAT